MCLSQTRVSSNEEGQHFERHFYVTLLHLMLQLISVTATRLGDDPTEAIRSLSPVVVEELQRSLFDYPLKHFFTELWTNIHDLLVVSNVQSMSQTY